MTPLVPRVVTGMGLWRLRRRTALGLGRSCVIRRGGGSGRCPPLKCVRETFWRSGGGLEGLENTPWVNPGDKSCYSAAVFAGNLLSKRSIQLATKSNYQNGSSESDHNSGKRLCHKKSEIIAAIAAGVRGARLSFGVRLVLPIRE